MKNKKLYEKTLNILVDAYFNDTLKHANCYACAVGNIIAANLSLSFFRFGNAICWNEENNFDWFFHVKKNQITYNSLRQVRSTGYTSLQLNNIEIAFENASKKDDYMFNGLMAVIEVLDQIHENKDAEITNESKCKFTSRRHAPLRQL